MTIEIIHIDGICNTEALPIAVEGWDSIIKAGFSDGGMVLNWDDKAIVAKDGDEVKGVLVWARQDWMKIAFIKLGYVRPAFRRSGIYTELWNALVEKVRETPDLKQITSAVGETNEPIQQFSNSAGRRVTGRLMSYKVK